MKKTEITELLQRLDAEYGRDIPCYLEHQNAWQLLIATILSAQCTDARVNLVTKDLFVKYPDVKAFAEADLSELEEDIHSTGFYHNKARNIIGGTDIGPLDQNRFIASGSGVIHVIDTCGNVFTNDDCFFQETYPFL